MTGAGAGRGTRTLAALKERWAAVPPGLRGEYIMAVNRFAAGCLMFLATCLLGQALPFDRWALPILLWMACGLPLFVHLQLQPDIVVMRRCLAIVLDVAGATIMTVAGGESTAFVYVVYLWIIIGNGVRFGGAYLCAATFASLTGFAVVIRTDIFWRDHLALSLGLLAGLVMLPAYSFALIRQLAAARRQAEQADQAKSVFLASVSHELRTPLTSIIGMVELLRATRLDPDQDEMLATIQTAADGQLSLVQDVLQFSRIQAGHGRVEETEFDVAELLRAVKSVVAVEARKKGLIISTFVSSRTPPLLRGDQRHLREVLLNLCGNAIKFTATGSVTLAADGLQTEDGWVNLRLEVMDTGIGIAPEARTRIFELFTQANASIVNRFGGTGLGLALCERQVRLMGGTIGVDSEPHVGSTFWVTLGLASQARETTERQPDLPATLVAVSNDSGWASAMQARLSPLSAAKDSGAMRIAFVEQGNWDWRNPEADAFIEVAKDAVDALPGRAVRERFVTSVSERADTEALRAAVRVAAALAARSAGTRAVAQAGAPMEPDSSLAGLRVLVADDNNINRSIIAKMLDNYGAKVVFAANGEEALEAMTGGRVDIALLDVNMPVMDGIEAAQFYGFSVLGGKRIPMIALTAAASPEMRARCLEAGMNECLVKPVRAAQLSAAILKLIGPMDVARAAPPARSPAAAVAAKPAQVLDWQTLQDLKGLGGIDFVEQIIEEFTADGLLVLAELEADFVHRDIRRFRADAHSMCSIAANIGATGLRELCLRWEYLSEEQLDCEGGALLERLRQVWNETSAAFDAHLDRQPAPRSNAMEHR
jgi:two-component system sensor histidine kinase RpfC